MTAIHYVTENEMVRRTGLAALGYSQPDKERILIQKGLPKKLERVVKKHEYKHIQRGEEGPFPWAPLIGGIASGLGSLFGGSSQARSQDAATAEQRRQYDMNMERQQPWQEAGVGALGKLRTLMGLDGDNQGAMDMVRNQPGYQFRLNEGRKAVERSGSARGKQLSGQGSKELERYGQNFASNEYGNMFNQLSGLAGTGQAANQQMAGYGQNMVGQMTRQGQAQAGGAMTGAQGINQAVQGTLGNYAYQRRTDQLDSMFNNPADYGQLGPSDWAIGGGGGGGDWTSDIGW